MPTDQIRRFANIAALQFRDLGASAPSRPMGWLDDENLFVVEGDDGTVRRYLAEGDLFSPTSNAPSGVERKAVVSLTNAEMLALRATPKQLVAAPGAGKVLELVGGYLFFDFTAAYTETADNFGIKYTNGSGVEVATIEATGFVDAAADAVIPIVPKAPTGPAVANAALVLHNAGDGEFGGGNAANVVYAVVLYRIHTLGS